MEAFFLEMNGQRIVDLNTKNGYQKFKMFKMCHSG